jgi:mannitol-1-phosphate 5-dehydrogenase
VTLTGRRTYVGFGFGAIQAGLFLYEAFKSAAFCRLVVAEVLPEVVTTVRQAGGRFCVNVACSGRVEREQVGQVEIQDPASEPDRQLLVEAIADAAEIGTAIPSVGHYVSAGPGSLHRILAQGLRTKATRGGPHAVVYTAENHNRAAEILESAVLAEVPSGERAGVRGRVQFLNTVIGKMSGVVSDSEELRTWGLATVTPGERRAFLVEVFNRILISKIRFGATENHRPFRRGIAVFEEKEDLRPFEEAKLYGHNATHALAAYLGALRGVSHMADLREIPGFLAFLRAAFIEESGSALVLRHAGVDFLFTKEGYRRYADDLLARMTNPYLRDSVARVSRDPARKLGWDDRLIGTMRLALDEGVVPSRYALGAATALATMDRSLLEGKTSVEAVLSPLWRKSSPARHEKEAMLDLVEDGLRRLGRWCSSGFPDLC